MALIKLGNNECNRCGLCQESCPVFQNGRDSMVSELNEESCKGAWNCINCWKCMEVCPLDVDIYGLMMEKRRGEEAPDLIKRSIKNITRLGSTISLHEINDIRKMYGLPSIEFIRGSEVKALLDKEPDSKNQTTEEVK